MRQVWPDSFVEEANLTVNISALRKALGESTDGGRQFIETVPKKGYRFIAPVETRTEDDLTPVVTVPVPERAPLPVTPEPSDKGLKPRYAWIAGLAVLVSAIAVAWIVFHRPGKLTDKDTVVLADFVNSTGDPVFDDALRQGLSSQLEQSPFLNLLSDDRIAQTLTLMAQPVNARLTYATAREVCQRTGSAAVLNGTIAQVGTQYLLTVKATNCSNGDSLGSAEAQAIDKNHVLEALGKTASQIRKQLGESLASLQKYDAPAENVTTPSIEALKAYGLGYRAMVLKNDYGPAITLFQRAITLDPNFAMAHARLGTAYSNTSETALAADSVRRAYELRDRVSERERLYIASHYELFFTGDLDAARKVYELSAETYPRDAPLNNLGLIYSQMGEFDKALGAFQHVLSTSPGTGNRYANLVNGFLQLNRLDEAKAAAREAEARHIDSPEIHINLYWVAFLQRDRAAMDREAAHTMGASGFEDQMLNHQADTALYEGHLRSSRDYTLRAIQSAAAQNEKEAIALYQANGALREALVGNTDLAVRQAHLALGMSSARDLQAMSAIALALAGETDSAAQLAHGLSTRFPQDTLVQTNYLPAIRSATISSATSSSKTIPLPDRGAYELGGNLESLTFVLYPVYLRCTALLARKDPVGAAVEFQKVIDHPGVVRSEPIGALAYLGLARAYAASGESAKAKTTYEQFLALWQNADSDIRILAEAKLEYAQLRSINTH